MLMIFFVLAYVAPGSALAFVICRLIRTRDLVSVARLESARAGARLEGAQRAARAAEAGRAEALMQAREVLSQTGDALAIARNIETVGQQVQGLTDYLVSRLEGQGSKRGRGRHALPTDTEVPAIIGGHAQEGLSS
jgi:hypothetical protein